MMYLILSLLLMLPCSAFAQVAQDAAESKPGVDVQALLSQIKNPFAPQLPPPPPKESVSNVPQGQGAGQNNNGMSSMVQGVANNLQEVAKNVVPEKPKVSVEGLVWSDTIHQAIVNGQIVSIGDEVDGMRIINISRRGVEVSFKGLKYTFAVE